MVVLIFYIAVIACQRNAVRLIFCDTQISLAFRH